MRELERVPEYVKRALALHEIWPPSILLAASADISPKGEYCETWIVLTSEVLLELSGTLGKKVGKGLKTEDGSLTAWNEKGFSSYPCESIEKLQVENLASSGSLTAVINGEPMVVCRFSNTHARKFRLFTKLAEKLKKGDKLTDDDFKDEELDNVCPKCGLRYPEPQRRICPKCMDKGSLFKRVLSFVPRYKVQIGLILLCMLSSSVLNLASPYLSGKVLFDQVLPQGGRLFGKVALVVLAMVLTKLLALIIGILYGRINAGITAEVIYDLKTEVFSAMQRLSMSFFSSKQTGSLMTRINQDSNQLQYFFHDGLPYFIVNLVNIIGISVVMLSMNWKLALLVLLPSPFIVIGLRNIFPKMMKLFQKKFQRSSAMNSLINDSLSGIRVVKAFGKESAEVNRFSGYNEGVYSSEVNLGSTLNTVFPAVYFCMSIGGFIVWGFGGWQVVTGNLTFGSLMTFTGYMGMLYGPLEFMTRIVDWWSSCMNSAQRIFEVIDSVPDISDSPDAVNMPEMKGNLEFKNVSFSYEPNKPVLDNVSFDIKAGEMVGLVGRTGAGKSTAANIISRLYDVIEGEVLIDGINVRNIAIKDLRRQIGMVLQETYLFMGSIADNIRYAKPDASMEEVIIAARAANAHDFIMKLPDGYDTRVGTGGRDLSGGEKQRISIARAILHNPRILILDEATASVDTETERQIQESLQKLVKGRTTISIAHRLSTLKDADRLLVLDGGKLAESGTHSELVSQRGIYYKLIQRQSEAMKIRGVGE